MLSSLFKSNWRKWRKKNKKILILKWKFIPFLTWRVSWYLCLIWHLRIMSILQQNVMPLFKKNYNISHGHYILSGQYNNICIFLLDFKFLEIFWWQSTRLKVTNRIQIMQFFFIKIYSLFLSKYNFIYF